MKFSRFAVAAALAIGATHCDAAGCPYLDAQQDEAPVYHHSRRLNPNPRMGDFGVPMGGYKAVMKEIEKVLTDSKPFFPADFDPPVGPNYGGLMIRLAWHCAGSFRESDGRGGCDGGRIRFDPELNWPDNGNLDMALKLLKPVKEKFGESLSWGDLIILAGNTAIKSFGGPLLGFCGGRIDDPDGADSLILGPSPEQEELSPCVSIGEQGKCQSPLGPSTVGLIYVNPGGPVDAPGDPVASGADIRNIFGRMGFNDTETVALVGGGHAFGKCHGACNDPPCGDPPLVGIGPNTFTSGYEGAWTTRPTTWSNDYFNNLFDFEWFEEEGPGGLNQWFPKNGTEEVPEIIMLTADIAFSFDTKYTPIAKRFAADIEELEKYFAATWYRLTTADMGPIDRCLGDMVPPAQMFQMSLPSPPSRKPNFIPVRKALKYAIHFDTTNIAGFTRLAYNCAATFRETDYQGGCNGARIRFPPQIDWEINEGLDKQLAILEKIQAKHPRVSMADLIVLAGTVAIEKAGGKDMPFCGGRVDAMDAKDTEKLAPRIYDPPVVSVRDDMQVKGLSPMEGVALFARPTGMVLSNQYFKDLKAGTGTFTEFEKALLEDEFVNIVNKFIGNNRLFLKKFAEGWNKLMTADRFDGPDKNACDGVDDPTEFKDCTVDLFLIDAKMNKKIGPMPEKINLCKYKNGLSIKAVAPCGRSVKFRMMNKAGTKIFYKEDTTAPFTLAGDMGMDIFPSKKLARPGKYTIEVKSMPGKKVSKTFSVFYYGCEAP